MTPGSRAAWTAALWVAAAAVAMVAIDLGQRILSTNDEARFPVLAQDVLSRGAWWLPQLNGAPYNNKPPLLAWLIALASWPAGRVTQLTAVLPSALAAVGTALVVFAAGRSLFGPMAGTFAAFATITTQGWFLHARLPMPDMLVTLFITAAVAILWPIAAGRPGPWWLGFWGSLAAAFWTKGAAALLPLAVALAWGLALRPAGWWRALHLPAGLAIFATLVLPWWIGKLVVEGEAMRDTVVGDNLLWYLPRSPAVLAGPPQHLVGILFPWALVAPVAIWQAVKAVRECGPDRAALSFGLVWALALLVSLGAAQQQRLRYYLPLVPPVALLIGWWAARAAAGARGESRLPWGVYGALAGVVALATAVAAMIRPSWTRAGHLAWPTSMLEAGVMAGGLVIMLGALVVGLRRRRLARMFALGCLGSALWVVGWYHGEIGRRNAAHDYPRVGAEASRLLPEAPVVATWGVQELPLSFYLGRQVLRVSTHRDLRRVMSAHPRGSAVLTEAALAEVGDRGDLRVQPLDRLDFNPIVLVSYPPGWSPMDARR